jgi:hypothetical protein
MRVTVKRSQIVRQIGFASVLALAAVAAAAAESVPIAQSTTEPESVAAAATPSASPEPRVIINGQSVPVESHGSTVKSLPDGGEVTVTGESGVIEVETTHGDDSGTADNTSHVSLNITTDSQDDESWSSAQVFDSDVDRSSTSFSHTQVFSTGSTHVSTSP